MLVKDRGSVAIPQQHLSHRDAAAASLERCKLWHTFVARLDTKNRGFGKHSLEQSSPFAVGGAPVDGIPRGKASLFQPIESMFD
jgi:hypothetical protein